MIEIRYLIVQNKPIPGNILYTDNVRIDSSDIELFDKNFIKKIINDKENDRDCYYLITNENYLNIYKKNIQEILSTNKKDLILCTTFDVKSYKVESIIGTAPNLGLGRILVSRKKLKNFLKQRESYVNQSWFSRYFLVSLLVEGANSFISNCISARISTSQNFSDLDLDVKDLINTMVKNSEIRDDAFRILLENCLKKISHEFSEKDLGLTLKNLELYDKISACIPDIRLHLGNYYISGENYLRLSQATKFQILKI